MTEPAQSDATMAVLSDLQARTDLLNRLKRAEGQLRGLQRMLEAGDDCLAIASQMSAVRRALDSAYLRMTMCFIEQELGPRLDTSDARASADLHGVLEQVETLLGKVR